MSNSVWGIRVTLVNNETRWLANAWSVGQPDEAMARLIDLQKREGDFSDDWLETSDSTIISRAHIIEASVAPLPPVAI